MLDKLYADIGIKIKAWAVWMFFTEAIGAIITGFVLLFKWDFDDIWLPLLIIILGPVVAFVSSWLLYAFGQLVDDTHVIRNREKIISNIDRNLQTMVQPMIDEANEKAKREAEEKAKRQAEAIAAYETKKKAEQIVQKKEKTLSEKLAYALMFQSDDGMVRYLKGIQDEVVQNILKSPQHLIREQIKNLLSNM